MRVRPLVLATLAMCIYGIGACAYASSGDMASQGTTQSVAADDTAIAGDFPGVAPLFRHGNGLGVTSWDSLNSSRFLDEDEARALITEIAADAGIYFTHAEAMSADPTLMPDGTDLISGISFLFVSKTDAHNWRKREGTLGLQETIDILGCAGSLRDRLSASAPQGTYVVFYDPAISVDDILPQLNDSDAFTTDLLGSVHDRAVKELYTQVEDFITWYSTREDTALPGTSPSS